MNDKLVAAVVDAAEATLLEQRREFARGEIGDLDALEDAIKAYRNAAPAGQSGIHATGIRTSRGGDPLTVEIARAILRAHALEPEAAYLQTLLITKFAECRPEYPAGLYAWAAAALTQPKSIPCAISNNGDGEFAVAPADGSDMPNANYKTVIQSVTEDHITAFRLTDGATVFRNGNRGGWLLYRYGEVIRRLNEFESDFIDSALKAAPRHTAPANRIPSIPTCGCIDGQDCKNAGNCYLKLNQGETK